MKPIAFFVALTLIALPAFAETPEAGLAALQELRRERSAVQTTAVEPVAIPAPDAAPQEA